LATSQKVMPALGKRSEIGMNAEPMMPNACSMPCIWSTFTKASSVVILVMSRYSLAFLLSGAIITLGVHPGRRQPALSALQCLTDQDVSSRGLTCPCAACQLIAE